MQKKFPGYLKENKKYPITNINLSITTNYVEQTE